MRNVIIVAALALAACQGGAPEAQENNAAEANAAEANAATPSPEQQAALAALVPAYAGASEVRGAFGSNTVAFRTSDAPRQVADFYAAAARAQGFDVQIPEGAVMLVTMNATGQRGGLVSLTATRVGDNTEVQLMAAPDRR